MICFGLYKYTFVNYKYNVLLRRNNVCLMPLSIFVTLSRFDERKEIRIVQSKKAYKSNVMFNVAAKL